MRSVLIFVLLLAACGQAVPPRYYGVDAGPPDAGTCAPESEQATCDRLHLCTISDAVDNCGATIRVVCDCFDAGPCGVDTSGFAISLCNGVCTDLPYDPNNCGACGMACPPDVPCRQGSPACDADAGLVGANQSGHWICMPVH